MYIPTMFPIVDKVYTPEYTFGILFLYSVVRTYMAFQSLLLEIDEWQAVAQWNHGSQSQAMLRFHNHLTYVTGKRGRDHFSPLGMNALFFWLSYIYIQKVNHISYVCTYACRYAHDDNHDLQRRKGRKHDPAGLPCYARSTLCSVLVSHVLRTLADINRPMWCQDFCLTATPRYVGQGVATCWSSSPCAAQQEEKELWLFAK